MRRQTLKAPSINNGNERIADGKCNETYSPTANEIITIMIWLT